MSNCGFRSRVVFRYLKRFARVVAMQMGSLIPMPCTFFRVGNFFSGRLSPKSSEDSVWTIQRNLTLEPQRSQLGCSRSSDSARQSALHILQIKVSIVFLMGGHETEDLEDRAALIVMHDSPHFFGIA